MQYLGNYADWIKPEWIDYLIANEGWLRPGDGPVSDEEEYRKAAKAGWNTKGGYWHYYNPRCCPLDIPCPIETTGVYEWWFVKFLPGDMMPMHKDVFAFPGQTKRYWMPLQDYQPGHIFIYEDQLITDYRAGDLWTYDDINALHGACNIGYAPRITFQFTTYEADR